MIAIPEELLEQFERGNVLLFIGEQILTDLQGRAILDDLTAELVTRTKIKDSDYINFPIAAQIYEDEYGRNALIQLVRDRLNGLGNQPQAVHRLIANLTDCRVMVTTTIDQRLEQAFAKAGRPVDIFIDNSDIAFDDAHRTDLFMLRGSIARPESLTLTEDDYEIFFETQDNMSVILQGYLARMTILFVGYDLGDPYFKRLYRKVTVSLDDLSRRSYAFGVALSRRVTRWCERYGIEVIDVNAATFLEELSNQLSIREQADPLAALMKQPVQTHEPLPAHPYKLLDFYEPDDVAIFFGRAEETRRLTSMIHAHRLIVLYGASGTGKTSLLLAGVFPRLQQADPPYKIFYVRALEDPTIAIQRSILRQLPAEQFVKTESFVDFLSASAHALKATLLIVLDQFEEFFIRLSPQFRKAFIDDLGALYDSQDVPVKIILSLREDWLASINELEQRIPAVFHNRLRLLPLTREQSVEAIVGPAARLGIQYEPELLTHLLEDLMGSEGRNVLPPQLQLICSALYGRLKPGEHVILFSVYKALEGVRGVLQQYLEDELERLPRDERALAHATLSELVTSQGTKAVKDAAELALSLDVVEEALAPVLERLVRLRLLRALEHEAGHKAYELAHEYLIREIKLDGEAKKRKEAEELLKQEVDNWQRFGTLLAPDKLALINDMRQMLRLDTSAQALILQSCLQVDYEINYWLTRVDDSQQRLAILIAAAGSRIAVVRQRAARALGSQAAVEAVKPLSLLAIEDDDALVRVSARQALAGLNPEQQKTAVVQLHTALASDNPLLRRHTLDALTVLPQVGLPLKLRLQVIAARERLRLAWFARTSVATPTRRAIVMAGASLMLLAILVYTFAANSYFISTETNKVTGAADVVIKQGHKWFELRTIANTGVDAKALTADGLEKSNAGQLWGLWAQKADDGYRKWGQDLYGATKPKSSLPLQWYLGNREAALKNLLTSKQIDSDAQRWWVVSLGQMGAYDAKFAPQAAARLKSILLEPKAPSQLRDQAAFALAQIINAGHYSADQQLVNDVIHQILDDRQFQIVEYPGRIALLGAIFTVKPDLVPEELDAWLPSLINKITDPRTRYTLDSYRAQQTFADLTYAHARLTSYVTTLLLNLVVDKSSDKDLRISTTELLNGLLWREPQVLNQERVNALITILADKGQPVDIRQAIADIFQTLTYKKSSLTFEPLTNIVLDLLNEKDDNLTSSGIYIVGNLILNYTVNDAKIMERLSAMTADNKVNENVRRSAFLNLTTIIDKKPQYATQELFTFTISWLTQLTNASLARGDALSLLGVLLKKNLNLDAQSVFKLAISILSDPNEAGDIRGAAAGLIFEIVQLQPQFASQSTVDALALLLRDDALHTNIGNFTSSIRESAVSALTKVAEVNLEQRPYVVNLLYQQLNNQDDEIRKAVQDALAELYADEKIDQTELLFSKLITPGSPLERDIAMHALFQIALHTPAQHATIDARLHAIANGDEPIARMWANKTRQLLELAALGNKAIGNSSQRSTVEAQLRATQGFYIESYTPEPSEPLTFFGKDYEQASIAVLRWVSEQLDKKTQ